MKNKIHQSRKGQSLVLVALLLVVFIGLLAVVLDGGYGYLQRRAAQTAADAGALAGASEWCATGIASLAVDTAWEYAVQRNEALLATATLSDGIVRVETEILFSTFFGTIFNRPQLIASAEAEAGCFNPGEAEGIMPIAWSCRQPTDWPAPDPDEPISNYPQCEMIFNKTYIIMDSKSTKEDFVCIDLDDPGSSPPGALDCDYDDDGINDVLAGGDRSWLDLDGGGGGASEMVNWINGARIEELPIHTWLGGESGVINSVFQAVEARIGDTFLIPVFDKYCTEKGKLPQTACPELWDPGEDETIVSVGSGQLYYHVITFAAFTVTCVDAPPSYGPCPGHDAAGLPKNVKTIEGYFTNEFSSSVRGKPSDGGVGAGVYSVYLIR